MLYSSFRPSVVGAIHKLPLRSVYKQIFLQPSVEIIDNLLAEAS